MNLSTALLCDAAAVREDLLHVLGGGITSLRKDRLPAPFGVQVALLLEMTPDEFRKPHHIALDAFDEDNNKAFSMNAEMSLSDPGSEIELLVPVGIVPLAVPIQHVPVERPGLYRLVISLDGNAVHTLWFRILLVEPGDKA